MTMLKIDKNIYLYNNLDIMSNFDHEINPDAEEFLKNHKVYGDYPAWNFHGSVWFENGMFHCEIWQYHSHVDTISESSLAEIMESASDLYGSN
jgi:hypothetical protein